MMVAMVRPECSLVTERLEVRLPDEADRPRFVDLFRNEQFMVFSEGSRSEVEANVRFDRMLALSAEISFAKQPIVERSSQSVIGYAGVDWIEFEDGRWLEWGYRLTPDARGRGYATEASSALLASAAQVFTGAILGLIHPKNDPSHRVMENLGFEYWKRGPVQGDVRDLYRWEG
jgi:RimJ/RimL family protein N-acetyltransferase